MVSDILFDLTNDLDGYLNDSLYDDMYTGELRQRILKFRDEAQQLATEASAMSAISNEMQNEPEGEDRES